MKKIENYKATARFFNRNINTFIIGIPILLVFVFASSLLQTANAQFTDPLSVDFDGALPIDFEPLPGLTPISSLAFDIDGDGNLEILNLSTTSTSGIPVAFPFGLIPGNYPTHTNTISSKPNTGTSLPITITFDEPINSFAFNLLA